MAKNDRKGLEKLRAICSVLPESVETKTFGHPTFQGGKKRTFVVLDDHEQPGMLCLVFKADRWKRWLKSVKSTTFTEPGGPLGDSLISGVTMSTRESGKMEA
jgi:hypothetical protein